MHFEVEVLNLHAANAAGAQVQCIGRSAGHRIHIGGRAVAKRNVVDLYLTRWGFHIGIGRPANSHMQVGLTIFSNRIKDTGLRRHVGQHPGGVAIGSTADMNTLNTQLFKRMALPHTTPSAPAVEGVVISKRPP